MDELGNILEKYLDCTVYKTGKEKEENDIFLRFHKLKKIEENGRK